MFGDAKPTVSDFSLVHMALQSPIVSLQSGHPQWVTAMGEVAKQMFQSPIVSLQSGHFPKKK